MEKIYLAIPYSNIDHIKSFEMSNKIAARIYREGNVVYAPISHSHPIAVQEKLPGSFNFWGKIDKVFIDWCDYIVVVMMDGWEESKGIQKELDYCRSIKKPIAYLEV